jgi:hypothetical protein
MSGGIKENEEFIYYFDNVKYIFKSVYERMKYYGYNIHRAGDKPAYTYKCDGQIISQLWYKHNNRHRNGDLPAYIDYENKFTTYYKHGNSYNDFKLIDLINIQRIVKILYFMYKNKFVWSPDNLGGKFTKKQLLGLVS